MSDRDQNQTIGSGQPTQAEWVVPASAGMAPPPTARRRVRVSRRGLLVGAGAVGLGAAAITGGILYVDHKLPFSAKPALAANNQVAHLFRRAGFSARTSDVQEYGALGMDGAIERLLNYNSVADDLDTRLNALNLDLALVPDMQRWWLLRMVYSKRPLQEKMTLFWHGLLTSSYAKVGGKDNYAYSINQNNFLRNHALDTFDNILLGITQDPAMMYWLDLRLSKKTAPNENYARELMELFTLGVGGGYTQADVHDAARALTGIVLMKGGAVSFVPAQHDNTSKTLLGQTGNFDYKDVIRILAAHPATGPYLCKRLFAFFVHENPSDADVKPMVDAYYAKGHSILEVMRAMFKSPAFFAPTAYRSRIKSPAEFVVGAVRQLDLEVQGQGLSNVMSTMGQTLLAPPNVAGWPGDVGSANWLNTSTWLARLNYIDAIFNVTKGTNNNAGNIQATVTKLNLKTPNDLLNHYTNLFIDGQISTARTATLSQFLTTTSDGTGTVTFSGGQSVSTTGARGMLYLLLTSPDYGLN